MYNLVNSVCIFRKCVSIGAKFIIIGVVLCASLIINNFYSELLWFCSNVWCTNKIKEKRRDRLKLIVQQYFNIINLLKNHPNQPCRQQTSKPNNLLPIYHLIENQYTLK